jgi:hypothetical protein
MLKRSLLAAVALCATPAHAYLSSDLTYIEDAIEEATGTPVSWTRNGGSCAPKNNGGVIMGFYRPADNTITICQNDRIRRSSILNTLMHEGVHSMQDRCTKRPVLSDDEIRKHLTASDRREIRKFYPVSQHRAEGEARAVANYYDTDPEGYARFIRGHCA